jgi:hypothetical protein
METTHDTAPLYISEQRGIIRCGRHGGMYMETAYAADQGADELTDCDPDASDLRGVC